MASSNGPLEKNLLNESDHSGSGRKVYSLKELPERVLMDILAHAGAIVQCQLRMVCRYWKWIISSSYVREHLLLYLEDAAHTHGTADVDLPCRCIALCKAATSPASSLRLHPLISPATLNLILVNQTVHQEPPQLQTTPWPKGDRCNIYQLLCKCFFEPEIDDDGHAESFTAACLARGVQLRRVIVVDFRVDLYGLSRYMDHRFGLPAVDFFFERCGLFDCASLRCSDRVHCLTKVAVAGAGPCNFVLTREIIQHAKCTDNTTERLRVQWICPRLKKAPVEALAGSLAMAAVIDAARACVREERPDEATLSFTTNIICCLIGWEEKYCGVAHPMNDLAARKTLLEPVDWSDLTDLTFWHLQILAWVHCGMVQDRRSPQQITVIYDTDGGAPLILNREFR